jgi:cation diffusion facilitator CzcD-associated flavoprotein CzcO
MLKAENQILIVGAGPSGLALAAELKRRGVDTAIVDQQAAGANTSCRTLKSSRELLPLIFHPAPLSVPLPISPVYSAAKAAIHSFTQSLRLQLKHTNITVFGARSPG